MTYIPYLTLQRMPMYLNYLRSLPKEEGACISSGAIATALDLGEVLVRKDLAYTACVGRPKVGYVRAELVSAIESLLKCDVKKNAIVVGAGALGRALLSHSGFARYGIEVVAAYDSDPAKVGNEIGGKPVYDERELRFTKERTGATFAIICVPATSAQKVADELVAAGVVGILNFAPVQLKVAYGVKVVSLDVAAHLAVMAAEM